MALLEDNCGSVCLANQVSVQKLASQYGFKLVSTQIDQVGATDVTPQVLAMLAAKPQIILFGLAPGTDSITAIRAIRAQSANIPISECSACELPSFVAAAGGASVMHKLQHLDINTLGIVWARTPGQLRDHHAGARRDGDHRPRRPPEPASGNCPR